MPENEKKPNNAGQERTPPQRVETKGKVKKKSLWKRFKDCFFAEDAKSVGAYLWRDVIRPAIIKLIDDAGTNAIHMAVYGDKYPRARANGQTHVSYQSQYASNANRQRPYYNLASRYDHILEGCFLEDTDDAYACRDAIMSEITTYGRLSVLTLSQIVPEQLMFETAHTDSNWGWTSLNGESILQRVPSGWTISLPPAKPLPER